MVVFVWKVTGFRGLSLCSMPVFAQNKQEARQKARRELGFWLILSLFQAW